MLQPIHMFTSLSVIRGGHSHMHHFIPHVILMTGRQTLHHVHGESSHHFWALVIGHGVKHCHFHLYSEAQNKPMRH